MSMFHKIAVIAGDGTGPEVVREGLKVLEAVSKIANFEYTVQEFPYGAEYYLKKKEVFPYAALEEMKKFSAIYLGAVGDPRVRPGILEQGLLLKLRFGLHQYINLRPVKLYPGVETPLKDKGPEDIDFVVVRENNEGLYVGEGEFIKKDTEDEIALQVSRNSDKRYPVPLCNLFCQLENTPVL